VRLLIAALRHLLPLTEKKPKDSNTEDDSKLPLFFVPLNRTAQQQLIS
jgi:hypothetical protein